MERQRGQRGRESEKPGVLSQPLTFDDTYINLSCVMCLMHSSSFGAFLRLLCMYSSSHPKPTLSELHEVGLAMGNRPGSLLHPVRAVRATRCRKLS